MSTANQPGHALERDSLWRLATGPAIWGLHLLACYITAAVWCGKVAAEGAALGATRLAIAAYTTVALAAIAVVGWQGYTRHRHGTEATTHDLDTPEDRHRFLGFATLLLAGLSALGVIYAALAAAFFEECW
jgi:hypothetical protein